MISNDTNGPSPEFFAHLAKKLPSMAKEATKNRIVVPDGSITKVPCLVCGKMFGSVFKPTSKPTCKKCRTSLESGMCAAVTVDGNRYCLFKHPLLPEEFHGKIKAVSELCMDAILNIGNGVQPEIEELKEFVRTFKIKMP